MALLPVADALHRMLDGVGPLEPETVPVLEAAGRVLARDVIARHTQPPFDASAMDGYAVRAADVARLPASLAVIGVSAAGHGFGGSVGPGEAVRIFTGAPLPAGADAIVIQENATAEDHRIAVMDGATDPEHIRRRGLDFRQGDRLLGAGRRLEARELLLAAAAGHGTLEVHRRPVVAILATGDELVPPGSPPGPDQIVSSNPIGLAALTAAAGARPRLIGIARDTHADLAEKLAAAGDADILLTTGGASVGDPDLVAMALREAGFELAFLKIAMRPGKPMIYGRRGPVHAIGLSGNPVSSMIGARVFVVPLIGRLTGLASAHRAVRTAQLTVPLGGNGPRAHYMRARLTHAADGRAEATPLSEQDSSLISRLAEADALVIRPPGAPPAAAGDEVDVLPLDF